MRKCENCGGQLIYNIHEKRLFCQWCDSNFPINRDEEQCDNYRLRQFICPQCGGKLLTCGTEIAPFCTYCGSQVSMVGNISESKRPTHIVPFKLDKKDVTKNLDEFFNKVCFLPKDFKDTGYVSAIRGIYIPYWSYTHVLGDKLEYNFENCCAVSGGTLVDTHHAVYELNGFFGDIVYDASSSFYDDIGDALLPYSLDKKLKFSSDYLYGFYSDVPDVDSSVYEEMASYDCNEYIEKSIRDEIGEMNAKDISCPKESVIHELVMLPVWFLTYKSRGRVSYITVNGETGKMCADLPVDTKKALGFAGLISAVVFVLLMLFAVVNVDTMFTISGLAGAISAIVFNTEIKNIIKKENNECDLGMGKLGSKESRRKNEPISFNIAGYIICFLFFYFFAIAVVDGALPSEGIMMVFCAGYCIWSFSSVLSKCSNDKYKKSVSLPLLLIAVSSIAGVIVVAVSVANDIVWYFVGIMILLGSVWCVVLCISEYNVFASRKVPHFDREGGNNSAR